MSELRHTVRALLRTPGYTLVVVLTLAIGIGAATAIFSVLNAVMLRPLPFQDPERLVYVGEMNPKFAEAVKVGIDAFAPSHADIADLRREVKTLEGLAVFAQNNVTMTGAGAAAALGAARVSGDFFQVLGVDAAVGRVLRPDDERAAGDAVVVISHKLWRSRFGASPGIVGQVVRLNGAPHRIVGIAPPRFRYPDVTDMASDAGVSTDVWLPLRLTVEQRAERDISDTSGAIGRLAPGVTVEQARTDIARVIAAADRLRADEWRGMYAVVDRLPGSDTRDVRRPLLLLFGGVSLLLLVACSNAAHLFLARALGRAGELGVRAAMGASRGRLVGLLMTETLLVGIAGGAFGLLVTLGLVRALPLLNPGTIARMDEVSIDLSVFGFSAAMCLTTAVAVGLVPAWSLSRVTPVRARTTTGSRASAASRQVRRMLIVAQIALAVVLCAGAMLLIRSYLNVQRLDRGFSSTTLTLRLAIGDGYRRPGALESLHARLFSAIRAVPGVIAAGAVNSMPLTRSGALSRFEVLGYANRADQMVHTRWVTDGYLDAMGTRLVRGRLVAGADLRRSPPVLDVNETFERTYFGAGSAVGKHVRFGDRGEWMTVVGVIGDMRHDTVEAVPEPQIYVSYVFADGDASDWRFVAIRSSATMAGTVVGVRDAVQRTDPDIAISDVKLMRERVSEATALRRFQMSLLAAFAGVAVLLAAIGLYGLMAYTVRQRTMEIGIRLSLGAQLRDILQLVFGEGLRLTVVGLACGLAGAVMVTRLLGSMLYGVTATDPSAFVVVSLVLLFVGSLACWIPARRAARVDPIIALRSE